MKDSVFRVLKGINFFLKMQENAEKFSEIWYNKEYTECLFYYELQFISR